MNLYRMSYNEVLIHNQVRKQHSNNKFQLWLFLSVFLPFPYCFTLTSFLLPVFPFLGPPERNICWFFPPTPATAPLNCGLASSLCAPGALREAREDLTAPSSHQCSTKSLVPSHADVLWILPFSHFPPNPWGSHSPVPHTTCASCRLSYMPQEASPCIEGILYVFYLCSFPAILCRYHSVLKRNDTQCGCLLSLVYCLIFAFFFFPPRGSGAPAASGSQSRKENSCRVMEESC